MVGTGRFELPNGEKMCIRDSPEDRTLRAGSPPGPTAVSYTHLDVYKRQESINELMNRGRQVGRHCHGGWKQHDASEESKKNLFHERLPDCFLSGESFELYGAHTIYGT